MKLRWRILTIVGAAFLAVIAVTAITGPTLAEIALAQGPGQGPVQGPPRQDRHPRLARGLLQVVAETLDMSVEELMEALRGGQTVQDIAAEKGVEMADLAEAIYQAGVEAVNAAVEEGKLSQDQADRILDRLSDRRDSCVNDGQCQLFPGKGRRPGQAQQAGRRVAVQAIADTLDMSVEELMEALRGGQTVQDIAAEKGVEMADLAEAIYQAGVEAVNAAVEEGKLSQDQADRILDRLSDRRDSCVNDGQCQPPQGGRRGGHRPGQGPVQPGPGPVQPAPGP
ncbi:MAG: hypothetical protein ACE5H9_16950 [Anaerolineae bacterium]